MTDNNKDAPTLSELVKGDLIEFGNRMYNRGVDNSIQVIEMLWELDENFYSSTLEKIKTQLEILKSNGTSQSNPPSTV